MIAIIPAFNSPTLSSTIRIWLPMRKRQVLVDDLTFLSLRHLMRSEKRSGNEQRGSRAFMRTKDGFAATTHTYLAIMVGVACRLPDAVECSLVPITKI